MQEVVAKEVAEAEFDRLCDAHGVERDEASMSEEEREDFGKLKSRIVKSVQTGRLTIGNDGEVTFSPETPGISPLVFRPATGATFIAMDGRGDKPPGQNTRVQLGITELTRSAPGTIAKLRAPDLNVCAAAATWCCRTIAG
jgi:hypothetical protein